MRASGASAIKRTDRRAVGIECQGCQRMFPSSYAYDQHRRSGYLRGSACYAYPDEMRTTVTAGPRPNMSTATVERSTGQRMRGRGQDIMHIMDILQNKLPIISIFCI